MKNIFQPELQLSTLRLYGEFLCRRENWSGQLALAAFAGVGDTGFAAAASLAGASSLVVDSNTENMKAHFRDGAFDFIVNTLDEALRAIKNEIRLGRPIAIGLMTEPAVALTEAAERGLAAGLVLCDSDCTEDFYAGVSEAKVVRIGYGKLTVPSLELQSWLADHGWSAAETTSPKFPTDAIRQKWLRNLPTHQRSVRQGNRWIWMSAGETRS